MIVETGEPDGAAAAWADSALRVARSIADTGEPGTAA
jgi:hypothetical protein